MDLQPVARYENIADRLRRLALSPAHPSPNHPHPTPTYPTPTTHTHSIPPPYPSRKKGLTNISRENYGDAARMSEDRRQTATGDRREVDRQREQASQQSYTLINELLDVVRGEETSRGSWERNNVYTRRLEPKKEQHSEIEEQTWRDHQKQKEWADRYPEEDSLPRVKSDGSLKVQQILDSYNNYKLNKQKFLSSITPTETVPPPPAQYRKDNVLDQIDNFWNEPQEEAPKFQRSQKTYTDGLQQMMGTLQTESSSTCEEEYKPRTISRSKLIFKNIVRRDDESLHNLVSPRTRIPGKICRNDRTFTRLQ